MKKYFRLGLYVCVAILFSSCAKEVVKSNLELDQNPEKLYSFSAVNSDGLSTKTQLGDKDKRSVLWSETDKIALSMGQIGSNNLLQIFDFSYKGSTDGGETAVFHGPQDRIENYLAVYPAERLDRNSLKRTLHKQGDLVDKITYECTFEPFSLDGKEANSGNFFEGENLALGLCKSITDDGTPSFAFQNLLSLLELTNIDAEDNISEIVVCPVGNEQISGRGNLKASIDITPNSPVSEEQIKVADCTIGEPRFLLSDSVDENSSISLNNNLSFLNNNLSLNFGTGYWDRFKEYKGEKHLAGNYYLPLIPQEYSEGLGFLYMTTKAEGDSFTHKWFYREVAGPVSFNRAKCRKLPHKNLISGFDKEEVCDLAANRNYLVNDVPDINATNLGRNGFWYWQVEAKDLPSSGLDFVLDLGQESAISLNTILITMDPNAGITDMVIESSDDKKEFKEVCVLKGNHPAANQGTLLIKFPESVTTKYLRFKGVKNSDSPYGITLYKLSAFNLNSKEDVTPEPPVKPEFPDVPVDEKLKNDILALQESNKRFVRDLQTPSGAIKKFPDNNPLIGPYSSNIAVLGLLANSPTKKDLDVAKRYIDWYLANINDVSNPKADKNDPPILGSIYDFSDDKTPKGTYDSVDSYAATFLMLVDRYQTLLSKDFSELKKAENYELNSEQKTRVAYVVSALMTTMKSNYLTIAKSTYVIQYLMDNSEVNLGLKSLINLKNAGFFDVLSNSKNIADTINKDFESILAENTKAIKNNLWEKRLFAMGQKVVNWNKFYPDATSQLYPIIFSVFSNDEPLSSKSYSLFNENFPEWQKGKRYDDFPWAILSLAASKMGDDPRLVEYFKYLIGKPNDNGSKVSAEDIIYPDRWYAFEAGCVLLSLADYLNRNPI